MTEWLDNIHAQQWGIVQKGQGGSETSTRITIVHTPTHTHTHRHTHTHTQSHTHTHTYTYTIAYAYTHIHIHIHAHCPEPIGDQGDVIGGQCPLAPTRHYGNRIRSGSNGRLQFEAFLESCNCLNSAAVLALLILHCPSCCRLGLYSWLATGTLMMSWHIGFKLCIQIVRRFTWAPLLVIFLPLI